MGILSKSDIIDLLEDFYPTPTADDCEDIKHTFNAMYAALEAWVEYWSDCLDIADDPSPELANCIELTKAAGISWPEREGESSGNTEQI